MSIGRRETSNLRRRRLLVYQSSREEAEDSAVNRKQFEKLREARRPSQIYGTSVNQKLRGRWFSLVPVRRRAIAAVATVILGIAMLLCLGHWAAVAWQPLAYRAELARPLRLDRPDSIGSWVRAVYFAAAAGTSLLIYQLRRYRNDDFRGSYRIWPPVIALMCIASLDAVCQLVPWGGELIELVMGRRVALSGSDWIRIVLTVGGIALAMRTLAEVRHSKLAVFMMSTAIVGFGLPMAARWGVLSIETPVRWLVVTSSPMLATGALWVACGAYLRRLFREVRKMDTEDVLALRLAQWRQQITAFWINLRRREPDPAETAAKKPKPARKTSKPDIKPEAEVEIPAVAAKVEAAEAAEKGAKKPSLLSRLWWRKPNKDADAVDGTTDSVKSTDDVKSKSNAASNTGRSTSPPQAAASAEVDEPAKPAKSGFFGWFSKKKQTDATDDPGAASERAETNAHQPKGRGERVNSNPGGGSNGSVHDDESDDETGGDPSIDWSTMGKAERRKLRREMKRGGNAA